MRLENKKPKLIVLLGPTACGKTSWSLRLAKKISGEIISADSRQIYKKMDIGTAKEPGEWRRAGLRRTFFIQDIPHHLIDFLDPGKRFTAAQFRDKALKYIKLSFKNGRQPMIVGGTGLYISAIVDNLRIPRVEPNNKLRESLEEKSVDELFKLLESLDKKSAESIDKNNKRRVIRALEVSILSGQPFSEQRMKGEELFNCLKIGIDLPREELYVRIEKRIEKMMKNKTELKYIEIMRKKTGEERLKIAMELRKFVIKLAECGIKKQNPKISKKELKIALQKRIYGSGFPFENS